MWSTMKNRRGHGRRTGPGAARRAVGEGVHAPLGAGAHDVRGRRKDAAVGEALLNGLTLDKVDLALIVGVDL